MDLTIGAYVVSNIPLQILEFFKEIQLINHLHTCKIIPISSQGETQAFRIISTNSQNIELDVHYDLNSYAKNSNYFQLSAKIDNESISILNTLDYGEPSEQDFDKYVEYLRAFLQSEISVVGYYDNNDKPYYRELEFSIREDSYNYLLDNKPWFIFKELNKKFISGYKSWIVLNENGN